MSAIDEFVPKLVALIKSSHAYKDGGMIVVTFEEAEVPKTPQTVQFLPDDEEHDEDPTPAPDWANSCCDEKPGPMWKDPGLRGPGGWQGRSYRDFALHQREHSRRQARVQPLFSPQNP
jgi:hypothetical protein